MINLENHFIENKNQENSDNAVLYSFIKFTPA